MTGSWVWLRQDSIIAIHEEQLVQHGGGTGIRDQDLLESALARPENLFAYGAPDAADLAAAYAFGIARNHPFVDGNKRTAGVAAITFLWLNDVETTITEADLVAAMLALAAGELSDADLAAWFRDHIVNA